MSEELNINNQELEINNVERRYELDLLKVVATIAMIMCHVVFRLGAHFENYEQNIAYFIADVIFGEYLAVAHAFMFAMGVGIVFSKKNKPIDLIKRGIYIYILAFVLNFFRYGIYAIIDGLIEGEFFDETVYALIVQDIFHFAGLALIFTGLLKALKLKEWHIFLVGVAFSIAGYFLAFMYDDNPALNYILGHFVVTNEDNSTFAFLNWYFFVGTGLFFGKLLIETKDKDKLYKIVFFVSTPIMIVYIILSCIFGPLFMCKNNLYYALSLPEAIGLLSIDLVLLSSFYFIFKNVPKEKLSICTEMSKNITPIYFAHWCIIGFIDSIFCYLLELLIPYWAEYLIAICLIFIAFFIARGWRLLQTRIKLARQKTVQ